MSLPAQRAILPIIIPGAEATAIIQEVVMEEMKRIKPGLAMAYPDGIFPGQKKLPAKERLARYVMVTDPADYPYLSDPDYVTKFKAGALPPLKSSFWLQATFDRDTFKDIQSDFLTLSDNAMESG